MDRTKFNFVQLRPAHECSIYILTAYHLSQSNVDSEGDLHVFRVPKEDIKRLIVDFGGYAHGTVKNNGKITAETINAGAEKEYALRPTYNDACWAALMQFSIAESEL
jgi:hypothetical protein